MTYHLQKYAGPSTRHTCPGCGKMRCFTLYVDEEGNAIDPSCGKCDHTASCGYHYPPRQFFKDHPERKPGKDWREDRPEWLDRKNSQIGHGSGSVRSQFQSGRQHRYSDRPLLSSYICDEAKNPFPLSPRASPSPSASSLPTS